MNLSEITTNSLDNSVPRESGQQLTTPEAPENITPLQHVSTSDSRDSGISIPKQRTKLPLSSGNWILEKAIPGTGKVRIVKNKENDSTVSQSRSSVPSKFNF